jgi:hypothetical protein
MIKYIKNSKAKFVKSERTKGFSDFLEGVRLASTYQEVFIARYVTAIICKKKYCRHKKKKTLKWFLYNLCVEKSDIYLRGKYIELKNNF